MSIRSRLALAYVVVNVVTMIVAYVGADVRPPPNVFICAGLLVALYFGYRGSRAALSLAYVVASIFAVIDVIGFVKSFGGRPILYLSLGILYGTQAAIIWVLRQSSSIEPATQKRTGARRP